MTDAASSATKSFSWRTPIILTLCACAISVLTFGPRSTLGFFLTPLSQANGWGRDVFALSLAFQNLLWGLGQPFAGAIADKYGAPRVLSVGVTLYALGLYLTASASTPEMLHLSAGILIGLGLSGSAVPMVIGALGKLLPESWRYIAFGAVTAAGSFGQFLFSPIAVHLMDAYGWRDTLVIFSAILLLVIPLSMLLIAPRKPAGAPSAAAPPQSLAHALSEAFGHRSYVLLVLGFFTCGFQLAFVTVHLPSYLLDRGLSVEVGGWTLAIIGLFNIIGSLGSGWLATFMPKRYILAFIYFARADLDRGFHPAAGVARRDADLRRGHRTAVALDRAAHVRPGGGDVRHALADDAVRLRLLQPPGRGLPRRLARRHRVRAHRLL